MADAAVSVAIPGIITKEYPDKQEKYLGYYNMSIGVGTCAGPVLGSLFYMFLSYGYTFGCFAALIFISCLVAVFVVPTRLNAMNQRTISMEQRGDVHKDITYGMFLTNSTAVLLIVTAIVTMVFEFFMDPIIGLELVSLGMKEQSVGYVFAVIGGAFGIGALVAGKLCAIIPRRIVIQIGLVCMSLSVLLVGPS